MSTFVVRISKNGGTANAAAAAAPVQVDATNAKGVFYVELTTADVDTAGMAVLVITNTGGTKTMEKREINIAITKAFFATAITGTLTTSTFTSDRTEVTNDYWKDVLVLALTGNLAGQVKKVGGYTGSTKLFTLATGIVFTAAPANGDIFQIINL
jgi:hypothetical protein